MAWSFKWNNDMRYLGFILMLLLPVDAAIAISDEHAEILTPIRMLFDGMRKGDGDKVRAAFHSEAIFFRAHEQLQEGGIPESFAQAVASPKDKIWDEKIWDIKVHTDGKLASVWTDFAFFLGDNLSHCGVNSFQLYRFKQGWKIIYLVDTRRTEGCVVPANAE